MDKMYAIEDANYNLTHWKEDAFFSPYSLLHPLLPLHLKQIVFSHPFYQAAVPKI